MFIAGDLSLQTCVEESVFVADDEGAWLGCIPA